MGKRYIVEELEEQGLLAMLVDTTLVLFGIGFLVYCFVH